MKREIVTIQSKKEAYEAPVIETIKVKVEQGVQMSGKSFGSMDDDDDYTS